MSNIKRQGAADGGADRRLVRGVAVSGCGAFTSPQTNIVTEKGKFEWEDIGWQVRLEKRAITGAR